MRSVREVELTNQDRQPGRTPTGYNSYRNSYRNYTLICITILELPGHGTKKHSPVSLSTPPTVGSDILKRFAGRALPDE